jgi:hypothetical protein
MRSGTLVTTSANPGRPHGPPFEAASPERTDLGYAGESELLLPDSGKDVKPEYDPSTADSNHH